MDQTPQLDAFLGRLFVEADPILEAMHERARDERFPVVGPRVGRLLYALAKIVGAHTVVELGSGFGYSAWWFARAVGPTGVVHLTDRSAERLAQARDYLDEAGLWERCRAHEGDALQWFASFEGPADVVFVDLDKARYPEALQLAASRLRPGGLLLADNVLWGGRVWDPAERDAATRGIRAFLDALQAHPAFEFLALLPERDGVAIGLRRVPGEAP